jgi:hypothetical protein
MNHRDDLTDRRGGLLSGLPQPAPSPELEARVTDSLRRRGLLVRRAGPRRTVVRSLGWLVAATACTVAGFSLGRSGWGREAPEPVGSRYMLLLYGGSAPLRPGETDASIVEEYRQWAVGLARGGRFVTGERLSDDAPVVIGDGAMTAADLASAAVAGYFVVSAASVEEARALARDSPHVRRGGMIVVRPIAPT